MADKVYAFRIAKQDGSPGELQVAPSPVIVGDDDRLELINLTDDDLEWSFPKEVFGAKGRSSYKIGKKNAGKPGKGKTDPTASRDEPAAVPYKVTPARTVTDAKGKTRKMKRAEMDEEEFADPVIIIEG